MIGGTPNHLNIGHHGWLSITIGAGNGYYPDNCNIIFSVTNVMALGQFVTDLAIMKCLGLLPNLVQ